LTETVKFVLAVLAVKLPVGERLSQLVPVQLCSETWALALVLVCAVTVSVCGDGAAPPATAVNVRAEELNTRVAAAAVTLRVTLAVCVPEDETMEMVPLHVMPPDSPD
jgi:uncharacterized membrane protein YadS